MAELGLEHGHAGDGLVQLALQPIVVRLDVQEGGLVFVVRVEEGAERHFGIIVDQGRLAPDDVVVGGDER